MAQLDRIILKHSVEESQADFLTALQNGDIEGGDIEPGEVVLRRGENFVEMWTLDAFDNPKQISIDIGGITVPWNVEELANARLSDLGDVDVNDGTGGLGISNAGWNLTWDGLKWVVRPPAAFGGEAGLIPSLNDVGDVNYAFYASSSNPKYTPDVNDILWYQFDSFAQKYYWAPTALSLDKLEDVDTFSGVINLRTNKWSRIQFGLVGRALRNNPALVSGGNSIGLELKGQYIRVDGGINDDNTGFGFIDIVAADEIRIRGIGRPVAPVLKYDTDFVPNIFVDGGIETAFTTLLDVRTEFSNQSIFNLDDVESAGIQNGYVLTWNNFTKKLEPSAGPAPDLTAASINELQDVDTSDRDYGKSLIWDPAEGEWRASNPLLWFAKWDYYDKFGGNVQDFPTDRCQPCNEDNLGRVTVVANLPYVCLRSRQGPQLNNNNKFSYIQILLNGYDKTVNDFYPPEEYRQETQFKERTDPLHPVAYEGSIGSLSNVSTADAFPGAALVYTTQGPGFRVGYPALNLESYSLGQLGNVDDSGSAEGYTLLWDGSQWRSRPNETAFRLDDMQDVQFGDLGVTNNKLVAAYMLVQNPNLPYAQGQDLSPVLAVSSQKATANMGTTYEWYSPDSKFYPVARYFGTNSNWTIQQKLDNYIWWEHEPSWQKLDGDACIEIWFYCTLLLQDRCIFSKSGAQGQGSYRLRLRQNGGLEWFVNGAQGQSGFTLTTPQNSVSLNNWHHVAVTKEGNTHRLYLDGVKRAETQASVIYTGNQRFALGRNDLNDSNPLTHNFWRGYMLDLRVTRGRAKYTKNTYTVPFAIGAEIKDTTPNAGDFLSYDGSKWTNVTGVTADISAKSINELADVDTTTYNPGTGDALVWTGTKWEPGIPGIGSTWALDDFTDVSTSYGGLFPYLRLDQATVLRFSPLNKVEEDDAGIWSPGGQIQIYQYDDSWTCDDENPGGSDPEAKFLGAQTTYITAGIKGSMSMRAEQIYINNAFIDCNFIPYVYHKAVLFYSEVPDRGDSDNPQGDIPGPVPENYIPCWGVIEDHFDELLPLGRLSMLGDVSKTSPTLGQALAWNGTKWAPSSSVSADISNNGIGDLADVNNNATGTNITIGHALVWDGSYWTPRPVLQDIFSFADIETITITDTVPISGVNLYNSPTGQVFNSGPKSNRILGLGKDGARGIAFKTGDGVNTRNSYIYGGKGAHFPTVITSGVLGSSASFLEVGTSAVRIYDNGATSNGTGGFRLGKGWIAKYEDPDLKWADFAIGDLPNKESITEILDTRFADLDLTPNQLEELGNVDTQGKGLGYALVWNGSDKWIASNSVAANISQSSIGGLNDVDKTPNANANTNNGSLRFDVGRFSTSRPWEAGGGIGLPSENGNGLIGWDSAFSGAPYLLNVAGQLVDSWLSVRPDDVRVSALNGIQYDRQPSLGDSTVPSWLQVKQQIIRSAVDYQALFYLSGDSFSETAYNWDLQVGVSTAPNPVYESKFEGKYSLQFRKVNQDKIEWRTEDGCPETFAAQQIWSIEFLIKIDSATSGDGKDEYILSPVSPAGASSTGLHVYIKGSDRKKLGVFFGGKNINSTSTFNHLEGFLTYDAWNHVYMAQEGGGNVVLYLNGVEVDTHLQTGSWGLPGGLAIGGRSQGVAFNDDGYLTGQLDDLRITDKWLPYSPGTGTVPVPVEPLPLGDAASVFGRLSMLEDVNTVQYPPIQGDALIYDALKGIWKPGAAPAADISAASINELTDVDANNSVPDQDDILGWNSIEGKWERTKIDGNGGIKPLIARSVVPGQVPTAGSLYAGELYLNMADKKLYALDSSGTAFTFATDGTYSDVTEIDGGVY